jgi:hypothetical protein
MATVAVVAIVVVILFFCREDRTGPDLTYQQAAA